MRPYFQSESVTLYHGDCLELFESIESVDAIVTDPPYNQTSLEWDVWPERWPAKISTLANQLWCFGSFRMFLDRRDDFCDWKLAQEIVWEKHNGSSLHNDRFRRVHELAVHFYQGQWSKLFRSTPTVHSEDDRGGSTIVRSQKPKHLRGISKGSGYQYSDRRLMRSVIPVASCHGYAVNETQKPEGIVAPLLAFSVPPGGIVLDPFAGSGTTLVVARAQGKRSIGMELRESQCEEIAKRLQQQELLTSP